MWTISINSVTNDGETAGYDESCSSTLASTFSNGKAGYEDAGVVSKSITSRSQQYHDHKKLLILAVIGVKIKIGSFKQLGLL